MLFREQMEEATELLDGMLRLLMRSAASKTGRSAYALRTSVGHLQANAENSIRAGDIGTNLRICFTNALAAGATFEHMDTVRRYIASVPVEAEISESIAGTGTILCLASMSVLVTKMTFRSRDDVSVMIARMRDALDPMKDTAGDDLPAAVYQTLNTLGATIMRHLSKTELKLPRVVYYDMASPMPALTIAHRVYQDTERSTELIEENKIIHPAFCMLRIRALGQ